MSYFSQFPKLQYDIAGNNTFKVVPDILRRVKIKESVRDNLSLIQDYEVSSGESPETVAYKVYGSTDYYYVVCLMNDIKDRYYDWPLDDSSFETYVKSKYANPQGVHHYEKTQSSGATTSNGPSNYSHMIECNSTDSGALSVSNYEYERRLQDQKRQIKILEPNYLNTFLNEFRKLIQR